jgi:hypothetical protein
MATPNKANTPPKKRWLKPRRPTIAINYNDEQLKGPLQKDNELQTNFKQLVHPLNLATQNWQIVSPFV